MSNVRYLAAISHGTPALRYARDINGFRWTYTKADAYRFKTKGEAERAATPPEPMPTQALPAYTRHPSRHTKDSTGKALPAWILDGSVAYEPMIPKVRPA